MDVDGAPLKVLFVTQFYPPDTGGGGIAAYAYYAAKGLKRRGHEVQVISKIASGSLSFKIEEGIPVYRIACPLSHYRWTRIPILGKHIRFLRDLLYAWEVRRKLLAIAHNWKPDIVEYADIDAEGFFHPAICPFVVKLHTPHKVLRPFYSAREVPYARYAIERIETRTIQKANGISSPSAWLAEEVARIDGVSRDRISLIVNPIDTHFFSPSQQGLTDATNPIVLYVGRMEPRKGALVFAKAIPSIARVMPNTRFIFLGADRASATGRSQKKELEQFFEQEKVSKQVEFHGHSEPEVFREFYRSSTVVVIPSLFENCPYTLLEAMACGKPVVVSRAGGMSEMVEDGVTGLLFEPGNSKQLSEQVIELLNSPDKARQLGAAARAFVERNYSLEVGIVATERFYQDVLLNKRHR